MKTLTLSEIKETVIELLGKYNAEYALLFGSYARGTATEKSDKERLKKIVDIWASLKVQIGENNITKRNAVKQSVLSMGGYHTFI